MRNTKNREKEEERIFLHLFGKEIQITYDFSNVRTFSRLVDGCEEGEEGEGHADLPRSRFRFDEWPRSRTPASAVINMHRKRARRVQDPSFLPSSRMGGAGATSSSFDTYRHFSPSGIIFERPWKMITRKRRGKMITRFVCFVFFLFFCEEKFEIRRKM